MAYHQFPAVYPSDHLIGGPTQLETLRNLRDSNSFTQQSQKDAVAMFFRYIGEIIDPDWGSDKTGVNTKIVPATFAHVGYPRPEYPVGYNSGIVVASLNLGCPVFMEGREAWKTGGHAWVIDGYDQTHAVSASWTCYFDEDGVFNGKTPKPSVNRYTRTFHCNFGWDGTGNGYYNDGIFNPSGRNYNKDLKIILNIKP